MLLRGVFKPSGKMVVCGLLALGLSVISAQARAADADIAAGCDPAVWDALKAKAEAQVAYDAAVTRSIVDKPDSVLVLSCFDQAAGVSAQHGGEIFGGDFTDDLENIMPVSGGGDYDCARIEDLWETIVDEGVNRGAPYATFENLVSGEVPEGGSDDFNAGWEAAAGAEVFSNLDERVSALPERPDPFDFSEDRSSCEVLQTIGLTEECP